MTPEEAGDACRSAFEHFCQNPKEDGFRLSIKRNEPPFDEDDYCKVDTQKAWLAWQEAWNARAPETEMPEEEAVEVIENSILSTSILMSDTPHDFHHHILRTKKRFALAAFRALRERARIVSK